MGAVAWFPGTTVRRRAVVVLVPAVLETTSLHIVHVNSMALGEIDTVLGLIGGARRLGLDVTTEAYPYTAGSTSLHSSIFDEGWQGRLGIDYGDLQWEATGERLTRETFERYRRERGTVILHFMKEEWIETALGNNWVIVASDGMPYAPKAHPRTATLPLPERVPSVVLAELLVRPRADSTGPATSR